MLSRIYCAACKGIDVTTVTVEVDISEGISFHLVGLADNAVKESQQRIGSALEKIGYRIPRKKIIINMAPAGLRKEFREASLPLMKYTNILTFNSRAIMLCLAMLTGELWTYIMFELVVLMAICGS